MYVDGLNLYYGALRGTRYKWLDLAALSRLLLKKHRVERVMYFTARIRGRTSTSSGPARQEAYLRALRTSPEVEIIYGHFLVTRPMMPAADPRRVGAAYVQVVKTEEKGSDVNLATHLVHDGHLGRYESAIVISNDSDLAEAIRIVREELGCPVGVLNPHKSVSRVLKRHATFVKQIRSGALEKSQFSDSMVTPAGPIRRPVRWA